MKFWILLLIFFKPYLCVNDTSKEKSLNEKLHLTKLFEDTVRHTYKYASSCMKSILRESLDPPSLTEIVEHHQHIHEITQRYRGHPPHSFNDYHGPWIENVFISHFVDKPITSFGGFIPLFVQWIDYEAAVKESFGSRNSTYDIYRPLYESLRRDYFYIAVSQHNNGIDILWDDFPNVIVISAGGTGNIPIPLIQGERDYVPLTRNVGDGFPKIELGFYGSLKHKREHIFAELDKVLASSSLHWRFGKSSTWLEDIANTAFNLAPRGYGRASFRFSEIIQLGRIPVYIYDDVAWIPYGTGSYSVHEIGFVGRAKHLDKLIHTLESALRDNITILTKLERVKAARKYYTYEGVMEQAEAFFSAPWNRSASQLECEFSLKGSRKHRQSLLDHFIPPVRKKA